MAIDHAEELLTTKEAAQLLKVSPVTIKRYLRQGRLPAYHVGPRAIRIRKADLTQVMQARVAEEVSMKREGERAVFAKPSPEEVTRRQQVFKDILALREQASIAPLTTAELVQRARQERTWYGRGR